MKEITAFFKAIWKWFDGNKTIICSVAYAFLTKFGTQLPIRPLTLEILLWVTLGVGSGSLIHHVTKGKFTTKSN